MSSISVARRHTGTLARVIALGVTALAAVCCWLAAPSSASAATGVTGASAATAVVAASAQPVLTDNAGGQPMFVGTDPLSPGMSRSRCITITTGGAQAGDQITFAAPTASGGLARWLTVSADIGTGGADPDCRGFVGRAFYQGRLTSLAGTAGDGIDTGWRPVGASSRSFRITIDVEASDAARGGTAEASFGWRLVRGAQEPPVVTPTPDPTREPTPDPTPDPTRDPTPDRTPDRTPDGPVRNPPTPSSVPIVSPSTGVPAVASPSPSAAIDIPDTSTPTTSPHPVASVDVAGIGGGAGGSPNPWTATLQHFSDTLRRMAKEPGFTFGPLLIALLFLLTQHLIDMRDPKLAAASRTKREIMLRFPLSYRESMHDPQDGS